MAPPRLVDAEVALKLFEGSERTVRELADNLDLFLTLAGAGIIVIGIFGIIVLGRQGEKIKEELSKQVADFRTAQLEFETSIREEVNKLNQSVIDRFNSLPTEVERVALKGSNETTMYLADTKARFEELRDRVLEYEKILSSAKQLKSTVEDSFPDPYLTYLSLRALGKPSDASEEAESDRVQVMRKVDKVIEMGLEGRVPSSLMFNLGMGCSEAELEDYALRLFTVAAWNTPDATNTLAMYRLQMAMGRKYAIEKDGAAGKYTLKPSEPEDQKAIPQEAFSNALDAAANARLPGNQIVYSELWNMAQYQREDGGFTRMLETLVASFEARLGNEITADHFSHPQDIETFNKAIWDEQKGKPIPSNLPGRIASVHALIGTIGWEENYDRYMDIALQIAAKESSISTWRNSFLSDAKRIAGRIGKLSDFERMMEHYKIDQDSVDDDDDFPPELHALLKNALMQKIEDDSEAPTGAKHI